MAENRDKTISVSENNHERIIDLGTKGERINMVITRLLDFWEENHLKEDKKEVKL